MLKFVRILTETRNIYHCLKSYKDNLKNETMLLISFVVSLQEKQCGKVIITEICELLIFVCATFGYLQYIFFNLGNAIG
jgi:hypothetical protein